MLTQLRGGNSSLCFPVVVIVAVPVVAYSFVSVSLTLVLLLVLCCVIGFIYILSIISKYLNEIAKTEIS